MARLEKRIEVLELSSASVKPPRITVTFVSPVHGTVGARFWGGHTVKRLDDETEDQFLKRVLQLEAIHGKA